MIVTGVYLIAFSCCQLTNIYYHGSMAIMETKQCVIPNHVNGIQPKTQYICSLYLLLMGYLLLIYMHQNRLLTKILAHQTACEDPESFVRGGPTSTSFDLFFCFVFLVDEWRG